VRGQGGQWLKADQDRICIDCESEQAFKSITRYFTLNDVEFEYKFLWVPSTAPAGAPGGDRKEITRLFVDGLLVGHVDYQEEGRNYVARTFFDKKPVKLVTHFPLADPVPQESYVGDVRKEAKAYFTALAKRAGTDTHQLALILSDLFLFPNPYQVADIFGLDDK